MSRYFAKLARRTGLGDPRRVRFGSVHQGHPPSSIPPSTAGEVRHNAQEGGMVTHLHEDRMISHQRNDLSNDRSETSQVAPRRQAFSRMDNTDADQGRDVVEKKGMSGLLREQHRDVFAALTDEVRDSAAKGRDEKVNVRHNASFSGNDQPRGRIAEHTPENSRPPETSSVSHLRQVEELDQPRKGVRQYLDTVDASHQEAGPSTDSDYLGKSPEKPMQMMDFTKSDALEAVDDVPGKQGPDKKGLQAGQKEETPASAGHRQRFEATVFDAMREEGREVAQSPVLRDMKSGQVSTRKKDRVEIKIGTISMEIFQAPRPPPETQVVRSSPAGKNNNGSPSSSRLHRFYLKGW